MAALPIGRTREFKLRVDCLAYLKEKIAEKQGISDLLLQLILVAKAVAEKYRPEQVLARVFHRSWIRAFKHLRAFLP